VGNAIVEASGGKIEGEQTCHTEKTIKPDTDHAAFGDIALSLVFGPRVG